MFSVLALGLLLACSCSPTVTPPAAPPTPQPTALAPLPELRAASGERWVMDEHTRASMRKLAPLLRGTDQSGPAQADAIDAELNALVKGCTMTGQVRTQARSTNQVTRSPRSKRGRSRTRCTAAMVCCHMAHPDSPTISEPGTTGQTASARPRSRSQNCRHFP